MAVDFKELRERLSIEAVASWLGLELKRVVTDKGPQLRGKCPCGKGSDRCFTVTPSQERFKCFGKACEISWGDVVQLTALVKNISTKEAATELERHYFGAQAAQNGTERTKDLASVSDYLLTEHEALAVTGLDPDTLKSFGAGYKPKGLFSGKLAIPIHDQAGVLKGYCGRALKKGTDVETALPKDIEPDQYVIGAHRVVAESEIFVTTDPMKMLAAHQHGMQAVTILTTTPKALRLLADWMEATEIKTCEWI